MELNALKVELLATLWENTYRAMVTDENGNYVATVRVIVNVPVDRELLPPNAPTVSPQLFVLVEDAVLSSKDVIDFETKMSAILIDKFKKQIPQCYFFYPSPQDILQHIETKAEAAE